jgi:hypothetical protein
MSGPGFVRLEVAPALACEMMLTVRIISESNRARGHWALHHRRHKQHREAGAMAVRVMFGKLASDAPLRAGPWVVTLTRVQAPRGRDLDDDNLAAAFKCFRDGVADGLRVNDGDKARVRWRYAEERGDRWAVRVRIEALEAIGAKERA